MCLITEQKRAKRIKEDMIVYKILTLDGSVLRSKYMWNFIYEIGKEYKTKITKQPYNNHILFDTYVSSHYFYEAINENYLYAVEKGFHSCLQKERAAFHKIKDDKVFKCIVPKGSLVFKDATGLIVSNRIIIQEDTGMFKCETLPKYTG